MRVRHSLCAAILSGFEQIGSAEPSAAINAWALAANYKFNVMSCKGR